MISEGVKDIQIHHSVHMCKRIKDSKGNPDNAWIVYAVVIPLQYLNGPHSLEGEAVRSLLPGTMRKFANMEFVQTVIHESFSELRLGITMVVKIV